jgi:hypothetical protein
MNHQDTKTPRHISGVDTPGLRRRGWVAPQGGETLQIRHVTKRSISRDLMTLVSWWLILWVCLGGESFAEDLRASVKTSLDHSTITVGDLVKLKLEVRRPDDLKIQPPALQGELGEWFVRQIKESATSKSEPGWNTETFELELTIYKTGEFEIPSISLGVVGNDGKKGTVSSSPVKIKVESVLGSGDNVLRDLKPQAEIPSDYRPLLFFLAIVGAFLVLVFQLIHYFRKRQRISPSLPVDTRTPEEVAREALHRLMARQLIEQGLFKNFYLEISEIIKRYLGVRLRIISLERTTEEILDDLKFIGLSEIYYRTTRAFLEDCDLVKFAKYHPSQTEVEEVVQNAFGILNTTEVELSPPVVILEKANS